MANIITGIKILCSIALLAVPACSAFFYALLYWKQFFRAVRRQSELHLFAFITETPQERQGLQLRLFELKGLYHNCKGLHFVRPARFLVAW